MSVAFAAVYLRKERQRENQTRTQTDLNSEDIERLRSLGYVGFVPAEKDQRGSGVIVRSPASYPGYNFFTNAFLCSAALVDENGRVKNYWSMRDCDRWANAEFLENGDILVVGRDLPSIWSFLGVATVRFIARLSWKGELLWKQNIPVHHDVEMQTSGDLLTLMIDDRDIPAIDAKTPVRDNLITILSSTGIRKESYSIYDLFHSAEKIVRIQQVRAKRGREIDLIHANSIQWIRNHPMEGQHPYYSSENILFGSRHQDTVAIVNWKEKKLMWSWGQGELLGPHDATMLPSGNILVFDNGLSRGWSRVLEIDPIRNEIVWEFKMNKPEDFYTASRGSNQRLPNGNTLIAESDKGHAFEVTSAGDIVWEFRNPFRNDQGQRATIVRFYRQERSLIDAIVRQRGEGRLP